MKSILRALALTGILGLGAAGAQAQRGFVGVRAPVVVAAVPACPGEGLCVVAGYYTARFSFPAAGSIADSIAAWLCGTSGTITTTPWRFRR